MGHIQAQKAAAAASAGPSKKEEKKKKLEEFNTIFKPVAPIQKLESGVNPKSVLCAFFKQGTCTKGDKCKFSHDMSLARKSGTRNYYEAEENEEDGMETWDDEKLKEVVEKKHGENDRKMPKTDIICKHFLDALENNKYGWFWECPAGGEKCHYRHVLPIGFVLKKDLKKEKKEEISIEDLVERERAALGFDLPKITLTSFMAWKKKRIEERRMKAAADAEKKKADLKDGKNVTVTGREIFTFNPDLIRDEDMDDGEATFDTKTREDLDGDEAVELDLEKLAAGATDVDSNGNKDGTVVNSRDRKFDVSSPKETVEATGAINEDLFDDDDDLDEEENGDDSGEESEDNELQEQLKKVSLNDSQGKS